MPLPPTQSVTVFSSSSRSDDYTPGTVTDSSGTTARLQNAFNEVFYTIKEEVFSALGISDLARTFGLI